MSGITFKTPMQRRVHRELSKYPEGATAHELRLGIGPQVASGAVLNALRIMQQLGQCRVVGATTDPDRKSSSQEVVNLYAVTARVDGVAA